MLSNDTHCLLMKNDEKSSKLDPNMPEKDTNNSKLG